MLRHLRTRLASLLHRGRLERELDAELRFHLDMLTDQNVRAGLPPDAARRAALRTFGGIDAVKEDVRDTWLSRLVETIAQDLRYGIRSLRRSSGFSLAVIAAMTLGIGANTAIFSVVNGVLLRPLPYPDGDRLVVLRQSQPRAGLEDIGFSARDIEDYRQSRSLRDVVEFHNMWFILLGRREPERVSTEVVSGNFFDVLGVKPLFGRTFVAADDRPGAAAVLVLGYEYWQRSFGADPDVVGRIFRMNDRPHTVIGVLPPLPEYPQPVDVYMPTSACPFRSDPAMASDRSMRMSSAMARVRPEVSLSKARADLDITTTQLLRTYPKDYPADGMKTLAVPLREELTRGFKPTLLILLATATFVLLIVCASTANLFVARMVGREREMAVRTALGATRARLLRQVLTESVLLASIGGACGLGLAAWAMNLLVAFAARFTTRTSGIGIDARVLLFTLGLSVLTGLVFGSTPAIATRLEGARPLRDAGRATQRRKAVRSLLVVGQVAASFVLLIAAGLTLRSVVKLQELDPGFRTDDILTMRVALNFTKYTDEARQRAFWKEFESRLLALPGVIDGAGGGTFPLNDRRPFNATLLVEGRLPSSGQTPPRVGVHVATSGYFRTIGQPIVKGRVFTDAEGTGDRQVVIVNESMARHFWPGRDPIGRRVSGDGGKTWATVIGVAQDARHELVTAPADEIYVPLVESSALLTMNWLVHSTLPPSAMEGQIKAMMQSIDPEQPVDQFRTLDEVRRRTLQAPRLTATLLGLFALLALIVTASGLAGVIGFWVNQRRQEFGIRMALGAARTGVLGLVVREGLQLVIVGLAIGMAGALAMTRWISSLLFEVQATDPLTYLAVAAMLLLVAAVSCMLPARRAASVNPTVALRAL